MDDLMPIGEFSDRSGLSPKRLRTYAAEGLLAPAAVDPGSGYRYYAPEQLVDAQVIDSLRRVGISLAHIRSFRRHPSAEQIDAWTRQLDVDTDHRREALLRVRHLLEGSGCPTIATDELEPGERCMTRLRTAGRTDIGRLRESNEDAIVATDRLMLVADGMGGHPGGEVAAGLVAGVVPAAFTGGSADELEAAVRAANWAIRERAGVQTELEGMGTTVCAAGLVATGELVLVNVGDSRAYLFRDRRLSRLTRDHSITAELIERGELAEEEAAQHPYHGVLTRALGVASEVLVDRTTLLVEDGDRIVVCSDGLFNELRESEIEHVLGEDGGVAVTVEHLIDRAVSGGGRDNVSVVVADVAA